jgi:small-conductance mechanosensitive channel
VGEAGPGAAGFDYDELARRLLVQVVRRLAAADPGADPPEASPAPDQPASPDQLALQETVSGLEYELATAWTKHGKLAEENVRLREQLKAAQQSLALAAEQVRRLPAGTDLDDSEVVLLQRLLTPPPAADSTDDSDAEAPSLLG